MPAARQHAHGHRRPPPACRFALDFSGIATHPPGPLSLSLALILSPGPLSLATEHAHRRRSPLPRPPPPPLLSDALPSSATTSSSSPSSHAAPEALLHLQRCHFRPRVPVIPAVDSPDPVPPLPRQQHQKNRGEPLHRFPHASLPNSPPSRSLHRSRDALPHGLVAGEAPVTFWSHACVRCTRCVP